MRLLGKCIATLLALVLAQGPAAASLSGSSSLPRAFGGPEVLRAAERAQARARLAGELEDLLSTIVPLAEEALAGSSRPAGARELEGIVELLAADAADLEGSEFRSDAARLLLGSMESPRGFIQLKAAAGHGAAARASLARWRAILKDAGVRRIFQQKLADFRGALGGGMQSAPSQPESAAIAAGGASFPPRPETLLPEPPALEGRLAANELLQVPRAIARIHSGLDPPLRGPPYNSLFHFLLPSRLQTFQDATENQTVAASRSPAFRRTDARAVIWTGPSPAGDGLFRSERKGGRP